MRKIIPIYCIYSIEFTTISYGNGIAVVIARNPEEAFSTLKLQGKLNSHPEEYTFLNAEIVGKATISSATLVSEKTSGYSVIIGPQGIQGPKGDKGDKGDAGRFNSVSVGITENGGAESVTDTYDGQNVHFQFYNLKGATGPRGISIQSIVLNANYTLTIYLSDGTSYTTTSIRGPQGPQGPQGQQGPSGTDGVGISRVELNQDFTLTIYLTNGTSYTTTSIRGAQGPQGPAGPNTVSTTTDTNISGLLKGVNGKVAQAIAGTDYLTQHQSLAAYRTASAQDVIDLAMSNRISTIESEIPSEASSSNKLADKSFVNSSIATNTAYFKGTLDATTDLGLTKPAAHADIATALNSHTFSPVATNNDYCFVVNSDSDSDVIYDRFKYVAQSSSWSYEYSLNNSSFTASQWAAINSGITSTKVTTYDGFSSRIGALESGKVDKEVGKGLSTNDYTNEDKAKVDAPKGWLVSENTAQTGYNVGLDTKGIVAYENVFEPSKRFQVALGVNGYNFGTASLTAGMETYAGGQTAIAMGYGAAATDRDSVALGSGAVSAKGAVAIGMWGVATSIYLNGAASATTYTMSSLPTEAIANKYLAVGNVVLCTQSYRVAKITAIDTQNLTITFDRSLDENAALSNKKCDIPSTWAKGQSSVAIGGLSEGQKAIAVGENTHTTNVKELAIGSFNKSTLSQDAAIASAITLGFGTREVARKNALEIKANGDAYIYGLGGYDGTNGGASGIKDVVEVFGDYRTASAQDVIDATKADKSDTYTKTETDSAIAAHHDSTKYDASNPSGYQNASQVSTAISAHHDSTKQNTIDSSHKLSADLVDDATTTNKFVTSAEKATWNGKQDALVFAAAADVTAYCETLFA